MIGTLAVLVLGAALVGPQSVGRVHGEQDATALDVDWRRDLRYLAEVLPEMHGNAFHTLSPAAWDSAAAALEARLPSLPASTVRAELAALVALVGDGHTRVSLLSAGESGVPASPDSGFVPLPIRPYWFSDGLHVREATGAHADLLGARVTRVGEVPAAEALDRLRRFMHRDNEMTVRLGVPWLLVRPAFLRAAGISDRLSAVDLELETQAGEKVRRTLRPRSDPDAEWIDALDAAGVLRPAWLTRNDEPYWFAPLTYGSTRARSAGAGRTLYLQFNAVRDAEEESLAAFADRLGRALAEDGVGRLIVDLRHNDGGNVVLARPLIDVIARSEVNRRGRLFVIAGRATFSAAGAFAARLDDRTEAVFVGEPTGSRPNTWGDLDAFTLPTSGLRVTYSERFFQSGGPYDERPWVAPEVTAGLASSDYIAGRDPALATIEAYRPSERLGARLVRAADEGSVEEALALYEAFVAAPERRWYWAFDDLVELGFHYWRRDALEASIPVWRRLAADYPDSPEGHENLAETYQALGEREAALDAAIASLRIEPRNGDVLEVLQEMCGHAAVEAVGGGGIRSPEDEERLRRACASGVERTRLEPERW